MLSKTVDWAVYMANDLLLFLLKCISIYFLDCSSEKKAFRMWEKWSAFDVKNGDIQSWLFATEISKRFLTLQKRCKIQFKINMCSSQLLEVTCNALSLYLSYNIFASSKNVTHKMILHCERGGFHHLPFWHQTAGDKNGLR